MPPASQQPAPAANDDIEGRMLRSARLVRFEAPWDWLASGWLDLWAMPGVGLVYGAIFAAGAAALAFLLWSLNLLPVFPVLAGGFLLLAPWFAAGLYEASRRRAEGERPTFAEVVTAGFRARGQLSFFGIALLIVFLVWLELAFILLTLFMGGHGLPPPSEFLPTLLFTPRGLGLLIVGSIVGGALAALVFAMSATAVPMLLTQRVDAVSAMQTSVEAVLKNPKPMALWAGLIAAIVAGGLVTLLAGFIIAFPLIGHATWHAYRDLLGN